MKPPRQLSLRRPLTIQPLLVQLVTLIVYFTILWAILLRLDSGGPYANPAILQVAAKSVVREPDGSLAIRMTPELAKLKEDSPALWFAAQDASGQRISFGNVPAEYASVVASLDEFSFGELRGRNGPHHLSAAFRQETGPAGKLTLIGHGDLTTLSLSIVLISNILVVPVLLILALLTFFITPWIVRRSLAGVARIAAEAEGIDIDRRGARLTEEAVPREIAPLVGAVNAALSRLDEGYEKQRRFIAAAAHELRTPIAILRLKLETSPDAETRKLTGDVARLSNLAEQLLDLHRLDHEPQRDPVDMVALVRRVVADLAPVLLSSGKTVEVLVDGAMTVEGDAGAIERVVTNLVQNAAEHGGGSIIVRVDSGGFQVEDDGPGIPAEERDMVLEPFHRIRPSSTGAGLGLNLVQQVVERHGGRISIHDAPSGGAIVRIDFPAG